MRKLLFVPLIVMCFGCSNHETANQSGRSYSVDSLFSFTSVAELGVALDDQRLANRKGTINILFDSTAQRLEVYWLDLKKPMKKIILRDYDQGYPPSANQNLPERWQTREGVYAGMSMGALQELNGKPFYIKFYGPDGSIWGWENGKLENIECKLRLIVKGRNESENFMLSQDIIDRKLDAVVSQVEVWPPGSPERTQPKAAGPAGDYPQVSTRVLTDADLGVLKSRELRLARNEIFARHGYIFKNEEVASYFMNSNWYGPRFNNVDDKLTDIEKQNIALLIAREELIYETRPVTNLMRALPVISLPINAESFGGGGVALSPFIEDPDGYVLAEGMPEDFDQQQYLVGLLPDTSQYYGVIWLEVKRLQVNAIAYYHSLRLTTFDKKFKRIASTALMVQHFDPDPGGECSADQEYSSMLNEDLTFSASSKTVTTCSDYEAMNDDDKTNDDKTDVSESIVSIVGRVNKDGTISVKN